ncbi:protein kinase [Mesorhizobium sp. M0340]|uniref:protein kinase domain-containing protein n=1 Tax=unclassified Mesorhizobium TaxID=325217 RepID=UPI0033360C32
MLRPYNRAQVTFDLLREIGQDGRNSRTYVARDHQLDAEIVIKEVQKTSLASAPSFFEESKALYASAHPNVVQIHYACEDANAIYLGMPYYRRGSVNGLMAAQRLTVREIVTLGCNVLSGLHNIHSKGLIHFDVKPDNVLLSERGEGLLSDFGLAKQMNFAGVALQDRLYNKMISPEATRGGDRFDHVRHLPVRPDTLPNVQRRRGIQHAVCGLRHRRGLRAIHFPQRRQERPLPGSEGLPPARPVAPSHRNQEVHRNGPGGSIPISRGHLEPLGGHLWQDVGLAPCGIT